MYSGRGLVDVVVGLEASVETGGEIEASSFLIFRCIIDYFAYRTAANAVVLHYSTLSVLVCSTRPEGVTTLFDYACPPAIRPQFASSVLSIFAPSPLKKPMISLLVNSDRHMMKRCM
jgi:hypothetical protein